MKNLAKLTFGLFAFTLLFTACSKDNDDNKRQVAKEITAEELLDYIIIEEYLPKASAPAEYGDKPILITVYVHKYLGDPYFYTIIDNASYSGGGGILKTAYDANTGVTTVSTGLSFIDLSRDQSGQIVVLKSQPDDNDVFKIKNFEPQYIQLVKKTHLNFESASYKNVKGNGYYRFTTNDSKWSYKENAVPTDAELKWTYSKRNNNIWKGQDMGTAQYNNLFIAVPKGNGWKGQHKDKDLMIVNTMIPFHHKAVGDVGVYEVIN